MKTRNSQKDNRTPPRKPVNVERIWGEHSRWGYKIFSSKTGVVYQAGNHVQASQECAEPGSRDALPLTKLRQFCIKTGKEIAAERSAQWDNSYRSGMDKQQIMDVADATLAIYDYNRRENCVPEFVIAMVVTQTKGRLTPEDVRNIRDRVQVSPIK